MKFKTVNTCETNIDHEKKFSINVSGKLFRTLSDKLYTNKLESTIREVLTNAWESHIAAHTQNKPVDVYLPTKIHNMLKIRDYGIGLSEENIYKLYTSYFSSSKDTTDELVGCFGLGSKSPFSLSNTFFVTSYYNNVEYSFVMYIKDDVPVVSKLGEKSTDEENGLLVSIPLTTVKYDISEILRNLAKTVYVLKMKINLVNVSDEDLFFDEYKSFLAKILFDVNIEEGHVYITSESYNNPRLIYGSNIYTLPDKVRDDIFTRSISKYLIFDLDIGSVNLSPNRETLSIDNYTLKTLQHIGKEIKDLDNKTPIRIPLLHRDWYGSDYSRSRWDRYTYSSVFSLLDSFSSKNTIIILAKDGESDTQIKRSLSILLKNDILKMSDDYNKLIIIREEELNKVLNSSKIFSSIKSSIPMLKNVYYMSDLKNMIKMNRDKIQSTRRKVKSKDMITVQINDESGVMNKKDLLDHISSCYNNHIPFFISNFSLEIRTQELKNVFGLFDKSYIIKFPRLTKFSKNIIDTYKNYFRSIIDIIYLKRHLISYSKFEEFKNTHQKLIPIIDHLKSKNYFLFNNTMNSFSTHSWGRDIYKILDKYFTNVEDLKDKDLYQHINNSFFTLYNIEAAYEFDPDNFIAKLVQFFDTEKIKYDIRPEFKEYFENLKNRGNK